VIIHVSHYAPEHNNDSPPSTALLSSPLTTKHITTAIPIHLLRGEEEVGAKVLRAKNNGGGEMRCMAMRDGMGD